MAFDLTLVAELYRRQINLRPQFVFEIDGVAKKFGIATIFEYIRVGDPGLYIDNILGDPWYIGGTRPLYDQGDWIQMGGGGDSSTSRITQQLQPDKGIGTSVVQLIISMIDKDEQVSELISPGFVVEEIIGRDCKAWLGFYETAFPNDFINMFRGVIEEIESGPGSVKFTISSSEQKKRRGVFPKFQGELAADTDTPVVVNQGIEYTINREAGYTSVQVQIIADAPYMAHTEDRPWGGAYVTVAGNQVVAHVQPVNELNVASVNDRFFYPDLRPHGLTFNQEVIFDAVSQATPIEIGRKYYLRDVTPETFKVSLKDFVEDPGAPTVDITLEGAVRLRQTTASMLQDLYEATGGVVDRFSVSSSGPSGGIVGASGPFFLSSGIGTTITLASVAGLMRPQNIAPLGVDPAIEFYLLIDEEIVRYTGVSGNTLTGVSRAQMGTQGVAHEAGDSVSSVVRLQGNGLDLARKLMMSGWAGPYKTGIAATHFNIVELPFTRVQNALFFFGVDLEVDYGLFPGEYVTVTGAANPANNITLKPILAIEKNNDGTYLIFDDDVAFVDETNTSAVCSFQSQWNTLGYGCRMAGWDIDLEEFDRLYSYFLSDFSFDFRVDAMPDVKTFIEEQIMRPMTCFSIMRKGRVSLSYHIGPIPGQQVLKLTRENVENASALKLKRGLSRNFYNVVRYEYDFDIVSGQYLSFKEIRNEDSVEDFNSTERTILIQSKGMRTSTAAETKIIQAANRFLNRYKRAAEYFDDVQIRFGDAYNSDVADIVIVDTAGLNVTDTKSGTRTGGDERIFQIMNRTLDIKNGKVNVALVDTNFDAAARYGLIAPASKVKSGTNPTTFVIAASFNSRFGSNEYLKWNRFGQIFIRVRSPNGTTRNAVAQIDRLNGNTVVLKTALPFTPQAGDLMEFATYNTGTEQQKFTYGFMRNVAPFDDGKSLYLML
jgi:hypothetical protein